MSGINSLSGLTKVNVDFRPTIKMDVQNTGNANQPLPGADAVPEEVQPEENANARSVVQQLDVLLLNAAGKSVSADAAENVKKVGKSLSDIGVLTEAEVSKLERLAADATAKLKALDKFSGRQLAEALMKDEKTNELVWRKGFWRMNATAKAVKAAIEAQQALSEAVEKLGPRLAESKEVNAELQNAFTEVQFQCDRRVSEIDSLVVKMYLLVQQDAVDNANTDPKVKALFDATFKELMPREAIMGHGTAESLELIKETFGEKMRPLAKKLDDFAADASKVLSQEEILSLLCDMADMKAALDDVRKNGLNETVMKSAEGTTICDENGNAITTKTEVDSSLLDALEKLLDDVSAQIVEARNVSVKRSRQAFLEEVKAMLSPENAPGGDTAMSSKNALRNNTLTEFKLEREKFVGLMRDYSLGTLPMNEFDDRFNECIRKLHGLSANLASALVSVGVDAVTALDVVKAVRGIHLVKAQFRALLEAGDLIKTGEEEDPGLAKIDVRRIMLGEVGISNVVEAKILGFKPNDVDSATEESNIESSSELGSGMAGKTYLLKTKSGGELVFKPELDSRIGLSGITLGMNGAYRYAQKTVNLNLATQDTAKAFGCEDLVVKYSVGSHNGQFGFFMEKAEGYSGEEMWKKNKKNNGGGNGIAPTEIHNKVLSEKEQVNILGAAAQKLNRLMWLDLITGQGDRHWNNFFAKVEKDGEKKDDLGNSEYNVTVKAIDNDASFASWRIGLQKFAIAKNTVERFYKELKQVCADIHGPDWEKEYSKRVFLDRGIVRNDEDGSLTVDFAKVESPEVKMAIAKTLGMQSVALPEEIDRGFYETLMDMDKHSEKKQAYLESIKPRISQKALEATEIRLNEAIQHAKKLMTEGKVYGTKQWKNYKNLNGMSTIKANLNITKSDKTVVNVGMRIDCVRNFLVQNCPSYFKRDFLHQMFTKPKSGK